MSALVISGHLISALVISAHLSSSHCCIHLFRMPVRRTHRVFIFPLANGSAHVDPSISQIVRTAFYWWGYSRERLSAGVFQ